MFFNQIIVGQGLAGTLLAYFLRKNGQKVLVIDNNTEGGASKIAAGLINPVTGRRIVKSWEIETFLPFAKQTYQTLEAEWNIKIWRDLSIVRTLKNADEENEWQLRSQWPDYQPFCTAHFELPTIFKDKIKNYYGFAEILQAAQVDLPKIIQTFRHTLTEEGHLINEKFDFTALKPENSHVFYKNYEATHIIFCEGANGVKNPYFSYLPFNIDKGELLIIEVENADFDRVFKNNIAIIPLSYGENRYWVGATNEWHSAHDLPTPEKRQALIEELNNILTIPYKIHDHQAAFRPTVKDRRPFLGFHPDYAHLAIFNGFGTKGSSMIPYWSHHFSEVLLGKIKLAKTVNIARFNKNTEGVG